MSRTLNRGVSLIEAIISVTIITGVVLALFTVFGKLLVISNNSLHTLQATSLLSEGAEVVRLWRDDNWDNLANLDLDTYYFYDFDTSAGVWATSTINQFIDGRFDRRFKIAAVQRDNTTKDIVDSGTLDSGTKLITVSVAWLENTATTTKAVSFYLTKLF